MAAPANCENVLVVLRLTAIRQCFQSQVGFRTRTAVRGLPPHPPQRRLPSHTCTITPRALPPPRSFNFKIILRSLGRQHECVLLFCFNSRGGGGLWRVVGCAEVAAATSGAVARRSRGSAMRDKSGAASGRRGVAARSLFLHQHT